MSTLVNRRGPGRDVAVGLLLAGAGGLWLSVLGGAPGPGPLWLGAARDAVFAVPLVVALVCLALAVLRPRAGRGPVPLPVRAGAAALAGSAALALAGAARGLLLGGAGAPASAVSVVEGFGAGVVVLLPVAALGLWVLDRPRLRGRGRGWSGGLAAALSLAVLSGTVQAPSAAVAGQAESDTTAAAAQRCLSGGAPVDKSFDVVALDVRITINRYGDNDPVGKMYALRSMVGEIRDAEASGVVSGGLNGNDPIQTLVLRANAGECVEVKYENQASGGSYGLYIDGLAQSTGASGQPVGLNESAGAARGARTTARYYVPTSPTMEGIHYMSPGPGYRSAVGHGLFGAFVVEPRGSVYLNANTGQPQQDGLGWEAIIKPAGAPQFREANLIHHEIGNDNERLQGRDGKELVVQDDTTGSYRPGAFALNYRSEPFRNRLLDFPKEKSHAYSSYVFGDPATPMPRGYLSDPTKIRILHAGAEKFHIYHLHGGGDRWRYNPVSDMEYTYGAQFKAGSKGYDYADTGLQKDPTTEQSASQRLDSQSIGPGESYNLEIEGGAGGVQQSAGDFLFHCHIAKHYNSGMWSMWRVYNTRQPDLAPVGDRNAPASPVDSAGLIGAKIVQSLPGGGTQAVQITAENLDDWIRPQLPPPGIGNGEGDATVWDWTTSGTGNDTLYLGEPDDHTVATNSARAIEGHPNLQPVDRGFDLVGERPRILFDPVTGRPAYPLFRTHVGQRPPFTPNGHSGAPYLGEDSRTAAGGNSNTGAQAAPKVDPYAGRLDGLCPRGGERDLKRYNVVAIAKEAERTSTEKDLEAKVFVLAKDKDAVLEGSRPVEPLAIRANQKDCVGITFTNEMTDEESFDRWSKSSMHIHHVQFDVQGSDGVTAGYAFEHSVRPYQTEDAALTAAAPAGSDTLSLSSVAKLVGVDAKGEATRPWIAVGQGTDGIEIRQVIQVDADAGTVELNAPLAKDHPAGQYAGTEFIQYRWYPDVLLDNVFWHDHVDGIHGWGHGLVGQLIVEPAGSTYHDPVTGEQVDSGSIVDIRTRPGHPLAPGVVEGSFREMALWTIDDNDKSEYSTFNLRAAPFDERGDDEHRFSSYKYGDPNTPLPRLYQGDPLVIRTVNVAPTLDTLKVQGGAFTPEFRYLDGGGGSAATLEDTVKQGVSEKYTLVLNSRDAATRLRPGDYLYSNGVDFRQRQGAWGIIRVLDKPAGDLKPLVPAGAQEPQAPAASGGQPAQTGTVPAYTGDPGNPCPAGAPQRKFAVSAVELPSGSGAEAAFVPTGDAAAAQSGALKPEPLVLHAAAGDCVTVTFTNRMGDNSSFGVAKLDRMPQSSGVTVGWSTDQNVAKDGGSRLYRYYVQSDRLGTATIADFADKDATKDGLYGALVVAPRGAVFSDPATGAPRDIGSQVVTTAPGKGAYRDVTLIMADDDERISQDFMPYPTDANDTGRINYGRALPGDGDGAFRDSRRGTTPLVAAYAGDPLLVHAVVAPGSEQAHVLNLGGQTWYVDERIGHSNEVTSQGIGPGQSLECWIHGGAGGAARSAGDYFYGDLRRPFTQQGMWGLMRVLPADGSQGRPVLPLPQAAPAPTPAPTPPAAAPAAKPAVPVKAHVAKAGYGNVLTVNIDPNRGAASYSFQVQKRAASGKWSTVSTQRTDGAGETKSLTLPAGSYRVVVPASGAHGAATSATVNLTKPTAKVRAGTDKARNQLVVNVDPDKGSGYWTFQVQRLTRGKWTTQAASYRTNGAAETRAVNLRAGKYRVKVAGKYGYLPAYSPPVTLTR